jgi:cytochrome P450
MTTLLPNGPATPAIVQTLQWIISPISLMEACAKQYGDIFTLKLDEPIVFVSHPQALQQILTRDTQDLEAPGEPLFEPLLGTQSVITLSGQPHWRQRQLLMPPFHGERMRTYGEVIAKVTQEIISQWQPNIPFCVRTAMQAITLRVIMQAVFGLYDSPRAQKIEEILSLILDANGSSVLRAFMLYFPILQKDLGPLSPWGTFLRRREQVKKLIYEEIQQRQKQNDPSRTDVLSLLLTARDENDQPMTQQQLHDELITLLIAGHETTATALTWALYWIHKLPAVRKKLLQEIGQLGNNLDHNSIAKLPYLNAVCCETLRIYPVGMVTFPRIVKTPISMCGYQLPTGTTVMGCIYLTHHREDLYPQPKQFRPERFLEKQFSPYEYLPFGGGVKRCIGMAFAQFEMKVVLANILSRWELALTDNRDVQPKRRGLVTGPNRSIQMVVKSQRQVDFLSLHSVGG